MSLEKRINASLSKYPIIKKTAKRLYQYTFYLLSSKEKKVGDLKRVTPDDEYEYFFGYYDKSPWDKDDRYMLCLRVLDTSKETAPEENADILLIDTLNDNQIKVIGSTKTWNVQQGSMLQWRGPDFNKEIIYNDFIDGEYRSVILNVNTEEKKIIDAPVYSVSADGKQALTLDFSRLHRLRPGYGYSNKEEETKNDYLPDATAVWKIDLEENRVIPLLTYKDFYDFETSEPMAGGEHKVNHIMLNPSGDRFMVLHRWMKNGDKHTRLVTADIDGKNLYNLNDDKMTSHCYWKNDKEILAYANRRSGGAGYYLFKDQSEIVEPVLTELKNDGHPSYSPDGKLIVTDTYPDRSRMAQLYIAEQEKGKVRSVGKVFAPFKYDNDTRCDLHPRWNRKGTRICFDSVYEGKRRMYTIEVSK